MKDSKSFTKETSKLAVKKKRVLIVIVYFCPTLYYRNMSYKHIIISHILSASYSINNSALYLNACLQVLNQFGVFDYKLGAKTTNDDIAVLTLLGIASFLLLVSNWISYQRSISVFLESPTLNFGRGKCVGRMKPIFIHTSAAVGALLKSVGSSGSLYYLTQNFFGVTTAIIVTVICMPGNFISQFSFFIQTTSEAANDRPSSILIL